ncbi:tetratricopeptide repeat domain containing protein [Metarhizium guizhouense ARSEF 977]|uniref:Tetratricopeptide repeat domain containing protein n=1 Tax=Metarhizium guizhouense (strain ARSEF 977) TaxID=1276136 RepID=A0A0B4HHG1_METGA|nr:tetratricopeptide repeat domain containing protein [Metarhizium guizhouense ARSEF 977]
MPIAYTQAPLCGSSIPTTGLLHPQGNTQVYNDNYCYGLGLDFGEKNAVDHQRPSHQGTLVSPWPVFADESRGQCQGLIVQGSPVSTTEHTNIQLYPGILGSSNLQNSSPHNVSSFQPSIFGSAVEAQQSSFSTAYNPYPFVPEFSATTTSTPDNSPVQNSDTLHVCVSSGQTAVTLTSEPAFAEMGGGEIHLPQPCNHDTYKHFAPEQGAQNVSSAPLLPIVTKSQLDDLELPSTEPELGSDLLSSQPVVPAVLAMRPAQLVPQSSNPETRRPLTTSHRQDHAEAASDSSPPSSASEKNAMHLVKKRGPFNLQKRKETAETRKRKACLRCRVQKIRCDADQDEVEGSCLPCQSFSKVSKKTLHHVSCFRGKLTDVVLFRQGGLNLTQRWKGTEMKDVGDRVNTDIRSIQITLGICDTPIEVKVVRFRAAASDVVARFWTVREGERGDEIKKKKDLEPFCLVDIWATATYFEKYVVDNAIATIVKHYTPHKMLQNTPAGQDVINRTYIAAVQYYLSLEEKDEVMSPSGKVANPQKRLLGNLFIFWHANQHTAGSAYICGKETLNMKPELKDETYPLFGKVSVPRMILAQFDSINHRKLLQRYGQKVLRDLEAFIFRNQSVLWWPIYLTVFILLHEASKMSADRYRHARNNFGGRYRYSIPNFVEELQEGCNNILVHWHYYNCHPWPKPDDPWERHNHFMSELTSEQHDLVMDTMTDRRVQKQLAAWAKCRQENGMMEKPPMPPMGKQATPYMGSQTNYDWDHPCYWITQMFEERWQPRPTYQREYMH